MRFVRFEGVDFAVWINVSHISYFYDSKKGTKEDPITTIVFVDLTRTDDYTDPDFEWLKQDMDVCGSPEEILKLIEGE